MFKASYPASLFEYIPEDVVEIDASWFRVLCVFRFKINPFREASSALLKKKVMSGKRCTSRKMERLRWIEILGEGRSSKKVGHLFRSGMRRMGREYQGEGHGAGMYLIYMAKWITFGYQPLYDFNVLIILLTSIC